MIPAFKEWSYIVEALGKGKQSIILRKGGISEDSEQLVTKGTKFLLFPTLFHQAEQLIKPQWLPFLEGNLYNPTQEEVHLHYFVEVADARVVTDWATIDRLEGWHAWKDEVILERFERWGKSIQLLVVQVYELPKPVTIKLLPEYGGCKSWIQLQEDIDLIGKPIVNKMII